MADKKYFTWKALDIVYDLMEDDARLEQCPILVDFILENVKPDSEISHDDYDFNNIGDDCDVFEVRAIHLAAKYGGKVEVVKKLVQNVRDANFPNFKGITPMHFAAYAGKLEVMKVLVANTDHPNYRDSFGNTPMDSAAYWGRLDVVKFLVNVDTRIDYNHAIERAQSGHEPEVVNFLKAYTVKK